MNEAAITHSDANGWSAQRYLELGSNWFARRHTIEYLVPAYEGDELTVKTWISDWRNIRSTRKYRFIRTSDHQIIAEAETLWVFVKLATGKPTRIPPIVTDSFAVCNTL
jgi:acyl-CoA thioester hydrolase